MNTPVSSAPEPWLRGTYTDVPAVLRGVLHALDLAREDVVRWTDGFSAEQFHAKPHGLPAISFHMRHIARSLDRLLTYAEGNQLNEEQLTALKTEADSSISQAEILSEFHEALDKAAERIRAFSKADLEHPRGVGRKQLPTTIGGLLVHIADHTQRHMGQVVTTAKVVRSL
ncbi:DinB family protein [Silvibacterium acidisoli]|uniref:DinB family protein n=1 Tax=Acidobacteriaceae bacterium ZG23-2 TaxID=2883246 RepID=UPI00406D26E7